MIVLIGCCGWDMVHKWLEIEFRRVFGRWSGHWQPLTCRTIFYCLLSRVWTSASLMLKCVRIIWGSGSDQLSGWDGQRLAFHSLSCLADDADPQTTLWLLIEKCPAVPLTGCVALEGHITWFFHVSIEYQFPLVTVVKIRLTLLVVSS